MIKEKVLEILCKMKEDVDFEQEAALIDGKILDSLELMELISELEDTFDIEIGMDEIIPENFNSAAAICALVEKLQG